MRHGKRYSSRLALGSVATVMCLAATGCGGSGSAGAENSHGPYRVLGILAMTGPFQSLGKSTSDALEVEADIINREGGVNGRKIALEFIDDQGDPTKAVSLLRGRINGNRPDAVIAGSTSNESLAMLPILSRAKIINLGNNSSSKLNDPATYPYTFRPIDPNQNIATTTAKMFKAKGYRTVGLLTPNTASGASGVAAFTSAFQSAGLSMAQASYSDTDLDIAAPLGQLKAKKPDAVVFLALGDTTPGLVLNSRLKAGMTDLPFYGDQSVAVDVTKLVPPAALKNAYVSTYRVAVRPKSGNPEHLTDFVAKLKAHAPIAGTLLAYTSAADCLQLLRIAAKDGRSTDADKMKSAIENLAPQPAGTWLSYGQMKFSATDHFNQGTTPADYASTLIGPWTDGQFTAPDA